MLTVCLGAGIYLFFAFLLLVATSTASKLETEPGGKRTKSELAETAAEMPGKEENIAPVLRQLTTKKTEQYLDDHA